ncbi:hypothetical protein Cadr_000023159 [Camelus dromedarius]|uniref:Uncharacterized protein n=1 Tax=Camelus dromedarius TaxID=9838 RepID=A0A5N4CJS0_CAMDR|nr:hypothetical protein Cadr_000023159 [Camelus dromedarius]
MGPPSAKGTGDSVSTLGFSVQLSRWVYSLFLQRGPRGSHPSRCCLSTPPFAGSTSSLIRVSANREWVRLHDNFAAGGGMDSLPFSHVEPRCPRAQAGCILDLEATYLCQRLQLATLAVTETCSSGGPLKM